MKNWDKRSIRVTAGTSQYIYFRQESASLYQYLKAFPVLPKNPGIRYHRTWEFPDHLLSLISYFVEPKSRVGAYLSVPKHRPLNRCPGILALHPEYWGAASGKSVTVGFVEENEQGGVLPALPPERPKLSQHMKAFSYARELCERGFIVLSPDLPGFEDNRGNGTYDDAFESRTSAWYILYGSTLIAKTIHDLYAALTTLCAIDGVDDSAIGLFGYGIGGEFSVILTAFDRRVRATVAASGAFSYATVENAGGLIHHHRVIPGFRADGNDFDLFFDLAAPVPLLALHTSGSEERRIVQRRREKQETAPLEKAGYFSPAVRRRTYAFLENELWSYRTNLFMEEFE